MKPIVKNEKFIEALRFEELNMKEQDSRPPKAWWNKCIAKAKGFADDPDAYCGWLYFNPEEAKPGMKKAFGEQAKDESEEKHMERFVNSVGDLKILEAMRKKYTCEAMQGLIKERMRELMDFPRYDDEREQQYDMVDDEQKVLSRDKNIPQPAEDGTPLQAVHPKKKIKWEKKK